MELHESSGQKHIQLVCNFYTTSHLCSTENAEASVNTGCNSSLTQTYMRAVQDPISSTKAVLSATSRQRQQRADAGSQRVTDDRDSVASGKLCHGLGTNPRPCTNKYFLLSALAF